MKKQILTAVATLIATSTVMAAPFLMGNVRLQDELVILDEKISCSAFSADAAKPTVDSISNGQVLSAVMIEQNFHVSGYIDGDLYNMHISMDRGTVNLSLQQTITAAQLQAGQAPQYSFSSTGQFTQKPGIVTLDVKMNGRTKSIGCALLEPNTATSAKAPTPVVGPN